MASAHKNSRTFFKCLATVLYFSAFLALSFPLLAEDSSGDTKKKKLSEEEEIAQMMDQLQQFKTSWEKKEQKTEAKEAAAPAPAAPAAAPVAAPAAPSAPVVVVPQQSIKITSQPAKPLPRSVQIKTDDGRILTLGLPPLRPERAAPQPVKTVEVKKPEEPKPAPVAPAAPKVEEKPAPKVEEKPVPEPVKAVEVKKTEEPKPEQPKPAPFIKAESSEDAVVVVQDDAARYQEAQAKPSVFPQKKAEVVVTIDEAKRLDRAQGQVLPADVAETHPATAGKTRSKWEAASQQKGPAKVEPPKPNAFAETFYLEPQQRQAYDVYDLDGFIFVKAPNRDLDTQYAIVTGFGGGAMKARAVPGLQTLDDAKKWTHDNLETAQFENVEIKKLRFGKKENPNAPVLYWVGQKAFATLEAAQQEVAMVQSVVESQGGNFTQTVLEAAQYIPQPEAKKPEEIKGPANFEREEELALKYLDQLDVGEKLFGVLQGEASGEKVTWQSFGETSWRKTNLDSPRYNSQVGYWTNRFVFKGLRFPMNTLDPFLEATISMDSTSSDFASNVKFFAGLEWRPFARNAWLFNYRPWGGISVLEWIKNYRFYIMAGDRKNLKDPIVGSADSDLLAGVQMFYEWGVELPPLDAPEPKTFSDFVERYVWGEYFGDYRYEKTNFSSEKVYNGILLNSSVIWGVKLPGIPLPENPITEDLVLMPYFRLEHINSTEFSFPYQNEYFVAVGCRWMPFRNYRYKENEWLSKTKLFMEYVGVGKVQHDRDGGSEPSNSIRKDLRFGVAFSSRRF